VCGAVLVWVPAPKRLPSWLRELLLAAGVALILFTVHRFRADQAFPGWRALVPCAGTMLAIYANAPPLLGRLLTNRLAVGLGLRSYSFYLVHWPVLVLYQYWAVDEPRRGVKCALIGVSLVLAAASYRFVETPFRKPKPAPETRRYLVTSALSVLGLAAIAGHMWRADGWPWRFSGDRYQQLNVSRDTLEEYVWGEHRARERDFAGTGAKKLLIVGDSQAGDLVNAIVANGFDRGIELRTLQMLTACQSVIPPSDEYAHLSDRKLREQCKGYLHAFQTEPRVAQADEVVVAALWSEWGLQYVEQTVRYLSKNGTRPVVLWGEKMQAESGSVLLRRGLTRGAPAPEAVALNRRLALVSGITFVNPLPAFCTEATGCDAFTRHKAIVFWDTEHLTPEGAKHLGQKLKDAKAFAAILD
jgi:hypothetical protein